MTRIWVDLHLPTFFKSGEKQSTEAALVQDVRVHPLGVVQDQDNLNVLEPHLIQPFDSTDFRGEGRIR